MVKPASFKSALQFSNRAVDYFTSQIRRQMELLQIVRGSLPEALAKRVNHCLMSGQKLVLYTDSAVWAAQLRFYTKSVLVAVEPVLKAPVTEVGIRLLIEQTGVGPSQKGGANLPSPEQLQSIHSLCSFITEDDLSEALLRLAKTLSDKAQGRVSQSRRTSGETTDQ